MLLQKDISWKLKKKFYKNLKYSFKMGLELIVGKSVSLFYPGPLWTTVEIFRGFGKAVHLSTTDTDFGLPTPSS